MITPAEAIHVRTRLNQLAAAQSTLDLLDQAIKELEEKLNSSSRNEYALQECITEHPILFGTEYRNIIPKHQLGSEYEMDYALVRTSGFVDLIELESSTLSLYTKAGNPRAGLVHAEQQIMDWLEWIEANGAYARKNLSELRRPRGFVIIGRRSSLTPSDATKLKQRNRLLSDVLTILTYDDLIDRAKDLRQLLTSEATTNPNEDGPTTTDCNGAGHG